MSTLGSNLMLFNLIRLRDKGVPIKEAIGSAAVAGLVGQRSALLGAAISPKLQKKAIAKAGKGPSRPAITVAQPPPAPSDVARLEALIVRLEARIEALEKKFDGFEATKQG